MSRTRPAVHPHRTSRSWRNAVALGVVVALAVGCTEDGSETLGPAAYADAALGMETLAGAALEDAGPGTCPEGFSLSTDVGSADANGNGWVCLADDFSETIDDEIVSASTKKLKVNGHGNFTDAGQDVEFQDISFSFHAIPTGSGDDAKGQFEFHDRANDLEVHGVVACLAGDATGMRIQGVVTRSDDKGLPVGTEVIWFAEDNGEPGAGADRMTRPSTLGKKSKKDKKKGEASDETPCFKKAVKKPSPFVITGGNIQIH